LIAEPDNEELLKLKEDLNEIIQLQEELIGTSSTNVAESSSNTAVKERRVWKVFYCTKLHLQNKPIY
jgi:hypothetical protein